MAFTSRASRTRRGILSRVNVASVDIAMQASKSTVVLAALATLLWTSSPPKNRRELRYWSGIGSCKE